MAAFLVTGGRSYVVDRLIAGVLGGASGALGEMKYIHWGTSSTTATVNDIKLGTPATEARVAGTQSKVGTNDTYQVVSTITCNATSKSVAEAGLFSHLDSAAPTDRMLIRGDHAAVPVVQNDEIQYTFQLQIS